MLTTVDTRIYKRGKKMYGKYKKRPFKGKGKKMSATKKAYLAGLRRGKAMVRRSRSKRRWY